MKRSHWSIWGELYMLLALLAICAGIAMAHAHVVYGDWTCAVSRCVRVK